MMSLHNQRPMSEETLPSIPLPSDEHARLARLHALQILDSEPEPLFDRLVQLAAQACGVPIALLSLVDEDRQWFKANVGLPGVHETPRAHAFCAHAVMGDTIFEVPDAAHDDRFSRNPLVVGPPDIRFYAGAPLRLGAGTATGTLCVIDRTPRQITDAQRQTLAMLAEIASDALAMRQSLIERTLEAGRRYAAELAATEARYRDLVEQQSELVSLARPSGELVYVNAAYARHHGVPVAQLIGTNLFDKVPAEERAEVRRRVDTVLNTRRPVQADNRIVRADGQQRHFAWTNAVQIDESGRLLLHSVGRDVTERVTAEDALREGEAFLDRSGRVAGVGAWQLDLVSERLKWSAQTRRIHEVPDDFEPLLETAIKFYAPEARPLIESAVGKAMADGTPWDLELRLVTATGRHIWVRAVGEAEFESGTPVRLVGAFQDITERRALQDRLAVSERFLRKVTDSLPVRIAYIDAQQRYRFLNDAHCRRFGRNREDLLGRTLDELKGDHVPEIDNALRQTLDGHIQRFEFDEVVGGHRRRIEGQMIPDIDDTGQVVGVFKTGVDITERSAAEQKLRDLTAILESTDDLVVQTDRDGNITFLNPAARRALELEDDAPLAGLNFASFNTEETNGLFATTVIPALKDKGCWVGDTTVRIAGDRVLPVSHLVLAHRDAHNRIARFSAVMRDESAKAEARQEVMRQGATLRSVAESVPACIAVVGQDGTYRFVNSGFERWIGSSREHIVGRRVQDVLGSQDYDRVRPWIDRVMTGERVAFERDYQAAGKRLHFAVSYVPLWAGADVVDGFVGVLQDISEHRYKEASLTLLSERDALTGLLNRRGFDLHLNDAFAAGAGAGLAVLYIDLDRFKLVNDLHGHPVGDALLQQFAQQLRHLVRPADLIARIGGDEFAILMRDVSDSEVAERVAAGVVAMAARPFSAEGHVFEIGASVGVACSIAEDGSVAELIGRADDALYRVKRTGRGTHALAA